MSNLITRVEKAEAEAWEVQRAALAFSAWIWSEKASRVLDAYTNGEGANDGDGKE